MWENKERHPDPLDPADTSSAAARWTSSSRSGTADLPEQVDGFLDATHPFARDHRVFVLMGHRVEPVGVMVPPASGAIQLLSGRGCPGICSSHAEGGAVRRGNPVVHETMRSVTDVSLEHW